MDLQMAVNISFAIAGGLGSWVLHTVWDSVKALQTEDKTMASQISQLNILVAGNYITKDEHNLTTQALFKKLDKIEDKIDSKMDKGR